MDYPTPDSQINFRVPFSLKSSFTELCRANQITVSEALVAYMRRCIDADEILGFEELRGENIEKRLTSLERRLTEMEKRSRGRSA